VATSDTCVEPGRWTVGDYLAIRKRSYGLMWLAAKVGLTWDAPEMVEAVRWN
jgi:hypothetical protein